MKSAIFKVWACLAISMHKITFHARKFRTLLLMLSSYFENRPSIAIFSTTTETVGYTNPSGLRALALKTWQEGKLPQKRLKVWRKANSTTMWCSTSANGPMRVGTLLGRPCFAAPALHHFGLQKRTMILSARLLVALSSKFQSFLFYVIATKILNIAHEFS